MARFTISELKAFRINVHFQQNVFILENDTKQSSK